MPEDLTGSQDQGPQVSHHLLPYPQSFYLLQRLSPTLSSGTAFGLSNGSLWASRTWGPWRPQNRGRASSSSCHVHAYQFSWAPSVCLKPEAHLVPPTHVLLKRCRRQDGAHRLDASPCPPSHTHPFSPTGSLPTSNSVHRHCLSPSKGATMSW